MTIFEQAQSIVEGSRADQYGGPERNIETIAVIWTALLHNADLLPKEKSIDPGMVCSLFRAMKEVRLAKNRNHHDSLVDICGYAYVQSLIQYPHEN